ARRLAAAGMNTGTAGNLSARMPNGYLITPSAVAYESMSPEDLVFMGDDWTHSGGQRPASSEWRLHRDIYRARPDIHAVVHAHSPFATTLACLKRPIPAFHYEVALAGGIDIPCADYATFGTQHLSDAAVAALQGRKACLLANHGSIAIGPGLDEAVGLAEKVEALARMYWQALQVGEPALLDEVEMARVAERFAAYGKPILAQDQ
ncbi:MAG TPA: class II aldolase/adducin family protein, partial [Usitatibacter sp.]|nr:class II aldolase/adducin family protein [Usitatibacter sp.]